MQTLDIQVGSPIRALNGGLFLSAGTGMHPERTIDSWELIVVQRGRLGIREDDQEFGVAEGESLLLWPGRRHGGTEPYSRELAFYWLHFRVEAAGTEDATAPVAAPLTVPQHALLPEPLKVIELCRRFLDDQDRLAVFAQSGGLLVALMLIEIANAGLGRRAPVGTAASTLAARALALVAEQACKGISTAGLAALLQCNPDYLGRTVKRETGLSVLEHIHAARIRQAKQDLLDPRCGVADLVGRCGFEDVTHFRRIFKRSTGMTPSAWRSLYSRVHVNTI